jgi:hypothetical protein
VEKFVPRTEALGLARHAIDQGAQVTSKGVVTWDVSGRCADPAVVSYRTHQNLRVVGGRAPPHQHVAVDITVRCRRCDACLRQRAWSWTQRARLELAQSSRTWFVTLTYRHEEHVFREYRAQLNAKRHGRPWNSLVVPKSGEPPEVYQWRLKREQFGALHRECSDDLTKWLKRVRKESGAKLRYCLVAEAHKSGYPHYHALVHEGGIDEVVRKRTLQEQWLVGYSHCKLIDPLDDQYARYVCKYLSKAAEARVRASVGYGKQTV